MATYYFKGAAHQLREPSTLPRGEFPKDVFEKGKPTVSIIDGQLSLNQLGSAILTGLRDNASTVSWAKTIVRFLWIWAEKNIKVELISEDWVSYKQVIGNRGQTVSISNILTKTEDNTTPPGYTTNDTTTDGDCNALALCLLGAKRYCGTDIPDYKTQIEAKLKGQWSHYSGQDMEALLQKGNMWVNNVNFRKIAAAIDMLLYHPPNNQFSNIRVATLTCRYFQCNALTAYEYLLKLSGWNRDVLLAFIWTESVARDLIGILGAQEEIDKIHSYLPYMIDMGVVTKSGFAASHNTDLYGFVHAIGCLLQNPRSLRAYCNTSSCGPQLMSNAAVVAYTMRNQVTYALQITGGDIMSQADQDEIAATEHVNDEDETPTDAKSWLIKLKAAQSVPQYVEAWARTQTAKFINIRDNTIGSFVKTYYKCD